MRVHTKLVQVTFFSNIFPSIRLSQMEKKTKPASKATFLESIPSQLRYAYLALKKKQDAKPVRDRDRDLNAIISGHNFGYLSFEKICKNVFEPEGCLLRFDAVSCQLVLEMSSSKVMRMKQRIALAPCRFIVYSH